MDCFAGSGVAGTASRGVCRFLGIEAHPLIAELAALKLANPPAEPARLTTYAAQVVTRAIERMRPLTERDVEAAPSLVTRSYTPETLATLFSLRDLIKSSQSVWAPHLKWALLATLRDVATVRVGWPYQLPGTPRQPRFKDPMKRFSARVKLIADDLASVSDVSRSSTASIVQGDSRLKSAWKAAGKQKVKACISSPPYLNNFDYADATRLELYFWGDARTWGDLTSTVRRDMIVASSQQSSLPNKQKALTALERFPTIHITVKDIAQRLFVVRKSKGRGK
jgi:hypothetical protein